MVDDVVSLPAKRAERDGTDAEFLPTIAFNRDSQDFVDGYEMGLLFARLDARPEHWAGTYHARNQTLIERTAAACGYGVTIEPSGDATWMFAEFTRKTLEVVRG